ncbi:MAG TPA: S41 family peptidase [Candidatus Saccharimonadales bacterium]|nr:S41 family peptidase [Candidatus Saccharimonadales bacterium]
MYISRKSTPELHGSKPWWNKTTKIAGAALVTMVIFGAGYGLGSGGLKFSTGGQNKGLPAKLDYSTVDQLYNTIKANYDGTLDQTKLLDGVKAGLATATGDPYTLYFNAKQASDFNKQLEGTFSGVGAELGQDSTGNLIVVAPIDGAPASKAGLRPQDIIASIDGKTTTGMSIDEAVSKIRGKKGTDVSLRIIRDKTQDLTIKITRDDIKIPSVKSQVLPGNIGYLEINQFSDDTASLAQTAAKDFKDKGVKGVILDLRGNPGGLVNAATAVSSLWLPEGKTILQERRGSTTVSTELANGNNILAGVPTVVLIDAGSASASEITAGALKDNGVATLIGVKSFGKGSVQQIINLGGPEQDGSAAELKVTIARWYRPNGQNIDKKGVNPDKEVKMTDDDYKQKLDPQKDAAIEFLNNR